MTDQNKQTETKQDGMQSKATALLTTKATTLFTALSNKFEVLAKLPSMKFPASYGLACLAIVIIVFGWKQIAVSQVESSMTKQLVIEKTIMADAARAYADEQYAQEEQRFGQVLSWAVRGELIRGNLDQIDQYLNAVVRMKNTDMVVLINNDGKLLLSTDKRLEGSDASDIYSGDILKQENIELISNVDDKKLLIIPITGINARLGTIVVSYNQPTLN